uniref:Uncharacterized protein n=1 Tax=Myotis myotis TaxID=51298 RepID=A0A7J7S2H3_MYOMY|nr:hypothetical protein mMyoMyo1_010110 [Myotis myotis]
MSPHQEVPQRPHRPLPSGLLTPSDLYAPPDSARAEEQPLHRGHRTPPGVWAAAAAPTGLLPGRRAAVNSLEAAQPLPATGTGSCPLTAPREGLSSWTGARWPAAESKSVMGRNFLKPVFPRPRPP